MTARGEYRTENLEVRSQKSEVRSSYVRSQAVTKRAASRGEPRFELRGAIAVPTRPRFGSVQVAAPAAGVGVLDFDEREKFFPVLALLSQRRRAIADLDPLHASILELACLVHVAEVFAACDGALAERPVLDGTLERLRVAGLDGGRDEVAHESILRRVVLPLLRIGSDMAKMLNSSRWMVALVCGVCLLALSVIDAQTTTAPPAAVTPQVSADQISTAMALLDRIDRIASSARKDLDSDDLAPVGTAGGAGASGKVTIRAADLDEIRAEIAQIKLLLQKPQ